MSPANTIPDLWGDDLVIDVLTPTVILNVQAQLITSRTGGVLTGELTGRRSGGTLIILFDVLAPAAHMRRFRLLHVMHKTDQVYPATITCAGLRAPNSQELPDFVWDENEEFEDLDNTVVADTQNTFIDLLGKALRSPYVKSLVQSGLALSNEVRNPPTFHFPVEDLDRPKLRKKPKGEAGGGSTVTSAE